MKEGLYLVISGPAGVGKDTVAALLGGWISVSATTRPERPGDVEGETYFFRSRETFETMIREGELLEYAEYNGNYYGTPATPARMHYEKGETVIFVIEVVGAAKIKNRFPDAVTVFLVPPSFEELRKRLEGRKTESPEEIEKRLAIARREIEVGVAHYDYVVVNDRLEDTVEEIKRIIRREKENRHAVSDPE
ncbi:MAG: guanylate kinase [Clostridia bacterium]|nr:guanylate kinase [Clostridia bacterium]MBR5742825.1 guanylate kinase [Clostridia bacterium]